MGSEMCIRDSYYYGCLLWGNNYDAPLSKVVKLQNKAVRIINDVPHDGINNPSLRSVALNIETSRYSSTLHVFVVL